jgi:hypothetical protein
MVNFHLQSLRILGAGLLFVCSASMAQTHPLAIQNSANDVQLTGKVIWMDLVTGDAVKARDFYRGLFNWEISKAGQRYFMASNDGEKVAGIYEHQGSVRDASQTRWVPYFSARDPDRVSAYITNNGGTVVRQPEDIEGRGRFLLARDPEGALFGALRSSSGDPEDRAARIGEWVWQELWASAPETIAKFYLDAGFQRLENPQNGAGGEDIILGFGGVARAGIKKKTSPAQRSTWLLYVRVRDVNETVTRARKLGGTVLINGSEIESAYPMSILADPTGGVFAVVELVAAANEQAK